MFAFPPAPVEYRIVEVRRTAAFAGKLGQRVSEALVLDGSTGRILVRISGSYHTLAVREESRLHVGDTVTIRGDLVGEEAIVSRERIHRVTP